MARESAGAHGGRSPAEPEPDVYVAPGARRDYLREHPTRPRARGRGRTFSAAPRSHARKAAIYARAGVEDYWILNLADRVLEIHREPTRLDTPRPLWGYRSIRALGPEETVSPLAAPGARIPIAHLLP